MVSIPQGVQEGHCSGVGKSFTLARNLRQDEKGYPVHGRVASRGLWRTLAEWLPCPCHSLAEVVLARQRPRFYTWLWRRSCVTAKSNSWAAVSLHRQIAICAIPFFQSLFDFRVAHAARNSWLTCVHQKGKQVGNFSQRERVEQARRHRRFLARQDFFNVFVGQRDFLATSL